MTKGPIIIVDDDSDDQNTYAETIKAIGIPNQIKFYSNAQSTLDYLYTTQDQPFIIISDVNLSRMTGVQMKEVIQADNFLRDKGIPFVFISTNASPEIVKRAHQLNVQGFFKKPASDDEFKSMLQLLFDYWALCRHINNTHTE